jgi:hypothetical protein
MFMKSESRGPSSRGAPVLSAARISVPRIVTIISFASCFQALEQPSAAIETNLEICELIEAARNG